MLNRELDESVPSQLAIPAGQARYMVRESLPGPSACGCGDISESVSFKNINGYSIIERHLNCMAFSRPKSYWAMSMHPFHQYSIFLEDMLTILDILAFPGTFLPDPKRSIS